MPISLHIAKHVWKSVLRLIKGKLGVAFDGDGQQAALHSRLSDNEQVYICLTVPLSKAYSCLYTRNKTSPKPL